VEKSGARGYPYKPDGEELRRRKAEEAAKQAQFQTELERVAKHLDVDGNGFITLDEVRPLFSIPAFPCCLLHSCRVEP
jgi:hypothetical protein